MIAVKTSERLAVTASRPARLWEQFQLAGVSEEAWVVERAQRGTEEAKGIVRRMEESVHQVRDSDTLRVSMGEAVVKVKPGPNIWIHPSFHELGGFPDLQNMILNRYGGGMVTFGLPEPQGIPDLVLCSGVESQQLGAFLRIGEAIIVMVQRSGESVILYEPPNYRPKEVRIPTEYELNPFEPFGGLVPLGPPMVTRSEWLFTLVVRLLESEEMLVLPLPGNSQLVTVSSFVDDLIRELAADPKRLYELLKGSRGQVFEDFMTELLERNKWKATQTKQTRDGGIDIFAYRPDDEFKVVYAWSCKRNNPKKPVGVEVVRELGFSVRDTQPGNNASLGVVATTSTFSPDALSTMERSRIVFAKDMHALQEMAKRALGLE